MPQMPVICLLKAPSPPLLLKGKFYCSPIARCPNKPGGRVIFWAIQTQGHHTWIFPKKTNKIVWGILQQRNDVVVEGVHVFHQPLIAVVVNLYKKIGKIMTLVIYWIFWLADYSLHAPRLRDAWSRDGYSSCVPSLTRKHQPLQPRSQAPLFLDRLKQNGVVFVRVK